MWWRKLMRTVWPFGRHDTQGQASTEALAAAERSMERAVQDRVQASATRAEAEVWAAQVRDHNAANRYDDLLRRVMRGED